LLQKLEKKSADPSLWENGEKAKELMQEISALRGEVEEDEHLQSCIENAEVLLHLIEESSEAAEKNEFRKDAREQINMLGQKLGRLENRVLFVNKYDNSSAIVSIHPGAGGLESQDWVEILMRMYLRWAEKDGREVEVLDLLPGDEAGIKSVTFSVNGRYAYGYLQAEKGVHRMVRISPFDTAKRRHTSFASVDVMPEVEEEAEYEINPEQLRIDTFRAQGAGGQHVNTTDSAVRMTHLPTGITAQSQSARSQHSNRRQAMRILQARVAEYYRQQQSAEIDALRGEHKEIAWGNQIRSYTFHPFTLVKDHRTGVEVGNINEVIDGKLEVFQEAYLRWKIKKDAPNIEQGKETN